jgi:hypothetical protein
MLGKIPSTEVRRFHAMSIHEWNGLCAHRKMLLQVDVERACRLFQERRSIMDQKDSKDLADALFSAYQTDRDKDNVPAAAPDDPAKDSDAAAPDPPA